MTSRFVFGKSPFYFARHGETEASRDGILQGQSETRLTSTGRRSAETLAMTLQVGQLGSIYSSPLDRAWVTASIISRLTKTPVYALDGLMERHWGIYEGKPKDRRPATLNPQSVETYEAFTDRVFAALQSINGPEPVLVIAHSGVFRAFLHQVNLSDDRHASVATTQLLLVEPPNAKRSHWHLSEVHPETID